jgi:hypothetical protein
MDRDRLISFAPFFRGGAKEDAFVEGSCMTTKLGSAFLGSLFENQAG